MIYLSFNRELRVGMVDMPGSLSSQLGTSLEIQWLGLSAFTLGTWVQFLGREIRSRKLCNKAKKKKKKFKLTA